MLRGLCDSLCLWLKSRDIQIKRNSLEFWLIWFNIIYYFASYGVSKHFGVKTRMQFPLFCFRIATGLLFFFSAAECHWSLLCYVHRITESHWMMWVVRPTQRAAWYAWEAL